MAKLELYTLVDKGYDGINTYKLKHENGVEFRFERDSEVEDIKRRENGG